MVYGYLADLVLSLHVLFVVYAVAGGLLTLPWPRSRWLHLSAVLWAAAVEFFGWGCPLTPLEWSLRRQAGQGTTGDDFLRHYLFSVLYPEGLNHRVQILLGLGVIFLNVVLYGGIFWLRRRRERNRSNMA